MAEPLHRTHRAGSLTREAEGQEVLVAGWVHRRRDLGGIVFLDLRDREGLVQLSCDPRWTPPDVLVLAAGLGSETVIRVRGTVAVRPDPGRDPDMRSREIEVQVAAIDILGPARTPVVPVARREGEELAAEELRLRHRILDLRRPELQHNLILRHRLLQQARATLSALGFLEIETPILTKPTPEGARDYLVPSRVHPGECYALPQSPQIYKQLLMVAGFDRYFQIARCFRDEDLRADRQPEFTQIDLEASFVTAPEVMSVVEEVLVALWDTAGHSVPRPFLQLSWHEAMERFGIDKPDLRYGFEIEDWTGVVVPETAAPFVAAVAQEGAGTAQSRARFRGIRVPASEGHGAPLSRKEIDQLSARVRDLGAGGLLWVRRGDTGWEGAGTKALGPDTLSALEGAPGDLLLGVVGVDAVTHPALHAIRQTLCSRPGVARRSNHAFAWVVDFPLFEADPDTGAWVPVHHPFTAPHPEDVAWLDSDPGRCRALHYDAVYNGNELGSGSIRVTDPGLQEAVFRRLGLSAEEIAHRFGFLLDGLACGAPPHGGFALGFDRIVMLLAGASSLRDVIAFPKTTAARALFEGAPTPVAPADLAALHLAPLPQAIPEAAGR